MISRGSGGWNWGERFEVKGAGARGGEKEARDGGGWAKL